VKSAEPVAARAASDEIRDCHTAPLWPIKVPILLCRRHVSGMGGCAYQSPVTPALSIGLLSVMLESLCYDVIAYLCMLK